MHNVRRIYAVDVNARKNVDGTSERSIWIEAVDDVTWSDVYLDGTGRFRLREAHAIAENKRDK